MKKILLLICILLLPLALKAESGLMVWNSHKQEWVQTIHNYTIYKDTKTGCEYILFRYGTGSVFPRLTEKGKPYCN